MRTKQQQAITKRFRKVSWGRLYWADNNPARVRRFDKGTVAIVYWKDSSAVTAYSTIEALVKDIADMEATVALLEPQELLSFTIAAGKQDAWQQYIEGANDYSMNVLCFASRWAHILESGIVPREIVTLHAMGLDIGEGITRYIQENAGKACSQADIDGITGGVEAAAVAILKRVWIYGTALNEWHRNKWGQS